METLQNALQRAQFALRGMASTGWKALTVGLLCAVFAASFTSCSGPTLRPDPVLPANYPTAEFTAGGRRWHGLGVTTVSRGQPLNTVGFSVQGYLNGTIRLVSEKCGVDDMFRYTGSAAVPYQLPGLATQSCLISIVTLPEYPGEKDAGVPIRSFKGALWVRVVDEGQDVLAFQTKVPKLTDATISIPLPGVSRVRAVFRGCGTTFDESLSVAHDILPIKLSHLFSDLSKITNDQCVFSGRIDVEGGKPVYVTWMVWMYGRDYVPLSTPSVVVKSGKLKVSADQNVTLIWLDKDMRYNTSGTFKFDASKNHTLRILTTGGRSVIGTWDGKEWSWIK